MNHKEATMRRRLLLSITLAILIWCSSSLNVSAQPTGPASPNPSEVPLPVDPAPSATPQPSDPAAPIATQVPAGTDEPAPAPTAMSINAQQGWQQTSLTVVTGGRFVVTYTSGTWTVDRRSISYVGPDGYSASVDSQIYQGCKVVSSLPYARLLGKIGNGATFSVGQGGTFTASGSGTLFLRINDSDSCIGDNAGTIAVTVEASGQQACGAALAPSAADQPSGQASGLPSTGRLVVMPPHPNLLERARRGEISSPLGAPASAQPGIDQPQQLAAPPRGTWKVLAILVQFSDNRSQVSPSNFDQLLFGGAFGSLNHYYRAVSYGALDIVTVNLPSSTGWCNMPRTYAYYVNGQKGFGAYPQNAQKLAEDAILAANPLVDFSQYDNDKDGNVDTVFIIHAGPGFEFTGDVNQIHSHAWGTNTVPVVDGVRVPSYTMEPEYWNVLGDMTVGVYAHELGHAFGLPDLYDTDGSSIGLGQWSLMASGSWNGTYPGGNSPAFLDAWSRAELNFASPTIVSSNMLGASIAAAETTQSMYRLWTNGASGSEYFLVENRQQVGYDAALPSAGLLIWHIDQSRPGNTTECKQLNVWLCGTNHYKVALVQADAKLDLENNLNGGDIGDPYPGSTANRSFTFSSKPNSSSYGSSTNTAIGVANISASGATMQADLLVRADSGNRLLNPSLEDDTDKDGKPDQWSTNSRFTRSSTLALDGKYSGRHRDTKNASYNVWQYVQNINAGTIYNYSNWVNIPQTSDSFSFRIEISWRDAANNVISTSTVKTYSKPTSGWNQAQASLVAPPKTTSATVRMVISSLNATIYVDKFVLQPA